MDKHLNVQYTKFGSDSTKSVSPKSRFYRVTPLKGISYLSTRKGVNNVRVIKLYIVSFNIDTKYFDFYTKDFNQYIKHLDFN